MCDKHWVIDKIEKLEMLVVLLKGHRRIRFG
jgi:hypothetical protein